MHKDENLRRALELISGEPLPESRPDDNDIDEGTILHRSGVHEDGVIIHPIGRYENPPETSQ